MAGTNRSAGSAWPSSQFVVTVHGLVLDLFRVGRQLVFRHPPILPTDSYPTAGA